jgi:hypothetical protein
VATNRDWDNTRLGSIRIQGLATSKGGLTDAFGVAFGSVIEQKRLNKFALSSGEYGLPKFYKTIVAPVLDVEDHTSLNYAYHFDIMQSMCILLTKKLDNDAKVS